MTPRFARIKQAVRAAIERCGHIDGAAATVERSRSTVGDWNNLNQQVFPSVDCALLLDEVAIAQDKVPPILSRYAAELGFVAIRLPGGGHGECELIRALTDASAEFGDVATEVRDATRDGVVKSDEAERIVAAIDEAMTALAVMRAVVAG